MWDAENRLVQVRRPGGVVVGYKYDALGRRIEQSAGGGWLRFTYDGADVVVDRAGYGAQTLVTTEYTNGLGIDDKLAQRMSSAQGSVTLYYLADHQGSTRALVNAAGNVVERQEYDSFGNNVGAGSVLTRYGYTGRERDALTGLYYYRARWYDPQQGRFISEDPIGFKGGINFYAYVENNPINFNDPLGLQKSCCNKSWSECYAQCIENNRLDNLLPLLGSALPKRFLPPFRVPYSSQPLTTLPSVVAHYVPNARVADALRGTGRVVSRVATPALVFEGFYDLGLLGSCAELCHRNPCN